MSAAFHEADEGFLVPPCDDDGFIPALLELCSREHIGLIVPTIDTELQALAEQRDRFRDQGTIVAISSPELISIGNDKRSTHAFFTEAGIPTVAQASAAEVLARPEGWIFPLIVKPAKGSAGIGVWKVEDAARLERFASSDDIVVQSIAPGVEHTIDFLVDSHGEMVCAVPRRRLEVRAGEVSKGMTVRDARLIEIVERLSRSLPGPFGVLTAQAFLDEDSDQVRVIELNPRFGGGFPLALEAGARFPEWLIEEALNIPSTARADTWEDGLVMLRWDDGVFVDRSQLGL